MALIKEKAESLKRKALLLIVALLPAIGSFAQTFAEWFSQGKTQIKYLTQQIAALNALRISTEQCYSMLRAEWSAISGFKNGEYTLHQGYYTSLTQVNPEVKNSTDLNSVPGWQQSITSQFNSLPALPSDQQTYVKNVRQNLLAELNKNLADLQTALTPGKLTLSDDERIRRVQQLTAAIREKYLFTCDFCRTVRQLAIAHQQDQNDTQTLKQLYGNP